MNALKISNIPISTDPKLSLREKISGVYKKDFYYARGTFLSRINKDSLYFYTLVILNGKQQFSNKQFYIADNLPELDFRIDYKRMKKDTIFLCQNFIELVSDVEKVILEKWEIK
jgi:hypothetical protein